MPCRIVSSLFTERFDSRPSVTSSERQASMTAGANCAAVVVERGSFALAVVLDPLQEVRTDLRERDAGADLASPGGRAAPRPGSRPARPERCASCNSPPPAGRAPSTPAPGGTAAGGRPVGGT